MTAGIVLVVLVIAQRLFELRIAKRNTAYLIAEENAHEEGASHYIWFVLFHTTWLAIMLWLAVTSPELNGAWIGVFAIMQAGRFWVLNSLGKFWTTRIIVVPDAPLVRHGPYRFMRHPNYFIVLVEVMALPMVFGAWKIAVGAAILKAILLWLRISQEEKYFGNRAPE